MSDSNLKEILLPESRWGRAILAGAFVLMLMLVGLDALRSCRRTSSRPSWRWTEVELARIDALEEQVEEVWEEGVYRLEAEHWHVQTEISERFTAEAALFMDLFHGCFSEMVVAPVVVDLKPTLHVFRSKSAYQDLHDTGSRGHFSYRWRSDGEWERFHLYTYADTASQMKFAEFPKYILLHEGAHAMLQRYAGKHELPPWLNEGIACFYEAWSLRETREQNMKNRRNRSSHMGTVAREDDLPTLKWLASLDYGTNWNPDRMGRIAHRNYSYSESFVDYLMASSIGKITLEHAFWRVYDPRHGVAPLLESEMPPLERGWHEHLTTVVR